MSDNALQSLNDLLQTVFQPYINDVQSRDNIIELTSTGFAHFQLPLK